LRAASSLQNRVAMRIKPILVTLGILGTTSLAIADPGVRGYRDDSHRDNSYGDHGRRDRYDGYRHRPRPSSWIPLTSHVDLDRRIVADVSSHQRFERLRIQNHHGRSVVRAIIVQFANGQRQRIPVHQVLAGPRAMVNVELAGAGARRIDRVVVLGRSGHDAALQLYAM
jgi:hypothetical protein